MSFCIYSICNHYFKKHQSWLGIYCTVDPIPGTECGIQTKRRSRGKSHETQARDSCMGSCRTDSTEPWLRRLKRKLLPPPSSLPPSLQLLPKSDFRSWVCTAGSGKLGSFCSIGAGGAVAVASWSLRSAVFRSTKCNVRFLLHGPASLCPLLGM
jgi:hypothetical protein